MKRRDPGFTLVELMVAVSILMIISATLGAAFVVTFRTADATTERLAVSHDVQLSTVAFASDIQSADDVWTSDSGPSCGPPSSAGGLLFLGWLDDGVQKHVTYGVETVGAERQLVRHACASGSADTTRIVSHFVVSVSAPSCDGSTCGGTSLAPVQPREVAMTVTATDSTHTLRGTRRSAS